MKLSMWGLLESIESPAKPKDMFRMFGINIDGWLVHIDFFLQKIIEKGILDVELTKRLSIRDGQGEDNPNIRSLHKRTESVMEIKTWLISIPLCSKTSFETVHSAI